MAFPPLAIDESVPADDGIVSQFPAQERTFRADLEDWLLIDHATDGHHAQVAMDFVSDPSGSAGYTTLWADAAGEINYRIGTGTVAPLLPPGLVLPYAGASIPEGWLNCNGSAVSRTTYAALFAAISTTYGTGDGSTTFNLPDLTGRVVAGKEASATRLTTAAAGFAGSTLGAAGGDENAQDHTHVITDTRTFGFTHRNPDATESIEEGSGSSGTFADNVNETETINMASPTTGTITEANPAGAKWGGNAANVQPTIVLNYIIKW